METRCGDSELVEMWLQSQPSRLTRDCYRRDAQRLHTQNVRIYI